ncbi:MAG: alkaline phosphatase family protein [Fidelibacterota bacterium]|nr:MAG: alkaline phosphatase family protein [Candidatus Neomarinimicrobiota bacterium]
MRASFRKKVHLSRLGLVLVYLVIAGCGGRSRLEPTVLLISLDGFRWDYQQKVATPNLDRLAETGVQAKALIPVFPTKTFPNHYTIVTGLYPENHGIVANTMFDPVMSDTFMLDKREAVSDGRWYGGEPIWVTAEKQGRISACLFWAGSEAEINGSRPTYWYEYDHNLPHVDRVNQVLSWLDLPADRRPQLICMYFPDTDDGGHLGTSSPAVIEAIQRVDSTLGILFDGLVQRDIMEELNIIVLSDHGMADIDPERMIFLDDYIDPRQAGIIDWSPLLGMWPPEELRNDIYSALKNAHPRLQVYRRNEVPDRFHYSTHYRIPPIIGIANEGWSIATRDYYDRDSTHYRGGAHGYDNRYPSMRGIFIARGPAFENGMQIGAFQNLHIYHLVAEVLDLEPAPNDGSLDSVKVVLD